MEVGYFSVEFEDLSLQFVEPIATDKELKIRLDVEIANAFETFKWTTTGSEKFSSATSVPFHQIDEATEKSTYLLGFQQLFARVEYVDLNPEVINGLCNANLTIKVVSINPVDPNAVPAKPAKGAKGAPPPVEIPAEEVLVSMQIPLHSLIVAEGCSINYSESFGNYGNIEVDQKVDGSCSSLSWRLLADNDLAGYVLGAKVFRWEGAEVKHLPGTWGLQSPDVDDPKAKVKPTPEDLRAKYIKNIENLVVNQEKSAAFTLSVGKESTNALETEEGAESQDINVENQAIMDMLISLTLTNGKISYDFEIAAEVAIEEDIRARRDLWSITWGPSPVIFLHRSQARKLVALIEKDPTHAYLPLTMKKMPTPESMAVEGGEIFATAVVELKDLLSPDSTIVALTAGLQGDQMENSQFTIKALLSSPLIPKSALDTLKDKPIHGNTEGSLRPADVISAKVVSVNDPNRDPLLDLREEISQTLERIAQEYLSLYPSNNNNSRRSSPNLADQIPPNAGKENESSAKEEKKVEFLNYLTTNGIFHELKENLKPKVQLVIKERYSNRGRALGKSDTMKQLDLQDSADLLSSSPGNKVSGEECVESVLNELYVFLLKECSIVLNSLFSDTVIDYNTSEVGKNALIDDEEETKLQLFNKLLQQATDCYADNRFYTAESCHLERIQLTNHIVSLGSDPAIVHDAYYQYANLLLSQAATTTLITAFSTNNDTNSFDSKINELKLKAREALAIAYGSKEGMWSTGLLYAAVLIESEQFDQAEAILDKVLLTQLSAAKVDYQLPSFVDFDGYESDKLCPVDPKVYGLLATYFSLQQQPIKARKALLMANRSFLEGDFKPEISKHGSPKRTTVLVLAETSLYMFKFGLGKLGTEAVRLALECEKAADDKSKARGKPTLTAPYIRQMLFRADSMQILYSSDRSNVSTKKTFIEKAQDALFAAVDTQDKVRCYLQLAQSQIACGFAVNEIADCFLNAMQLTSDMPLDILKTSCLVPLDAMVQVAKLLLSAAKFEDALNVLLFSCSVYNSATLFLLLGICCYRLDRLEDAEDALLEANLEDNRNPEIWGYLCLLALAHGPHRLEEADAALVQCLRLGLSNTSLLRELATCYMAVDKLQTAEDLIRRAMSKENVDDFLFIGGSKQNAYTRKLLADVMAGQSQAAQAVEEYQKVLADSELDPQTRLDAAERCARLLGTLGRSEELKALTQIINSLSASE